MSFRHLCRDSFCRALSLALILCCGSVRAQNTILHLRNGDRIAGFEVSENTNQVTLSNVWSREIIVPQSQINWREILLTPAPPAPPSPPIAKAYVVTNTVAATNAAAATNAVAASPIHPGYVTMSIIPESPNTNLLVWLKRWKTELSVGMDMERGTVDHQLYYGKARLAYAQPYESDPKQFFRNIFCYDVAYGKTDGVLSDNRMGGSSKTDLDMSRKLYVYNLGAASHDEIRRIDLHYEEGPGAGYHWMNETNLGVNLELGANYQVEERSDNTSTDSGYYRIGQDLTWKINRQMNLTEKIEYFPRLGYATQGRMRFESNLSCALLLNFSLNFTVVDLYDTQPALTVPNNDFQLRTSLGVKF